MTGQAQRVRIFAVLAIVGFLAFFFLPPLHQWESYHHFADDRTFLAIPNCLNVVSNLPFLGVGLAGLIGLRAGKIRCDGAGRWCWTVFFVGVLLTCFGSGYYHWSPNDATLVWDRLPMTISFMALLAAMIGERISPTAGQRVLWPLVVFGIGSVAWWRWTGNLWPYAGTQYFSIVLVGVLLVMFPAAYTRSYDLLIVTGWYALAKVFEAVDKPVYALTGHLASGHSIKHLIAALAVFWVWRMLIARYPRGSSAR